MLTLPVAVVTAVNVKGRLMPVDAPLTPMVPVYCASGRLDGGFSSSVMVEDAPGASDGMVEGDASDMYDVLGRLTCRFPLGAPPVLTSVNETSDCAPTTIPVFR